MGASGSQTAPASKKRKIGMVSLAEVLQNPHVNSKYWINKETAQANTSSDSLDFGVVMDQNPDMAGEPKFLVSSSIHPGGWWYDAASTMGFILAAEEDARERKRKGLPSRKEAVQAARQRSVGGGTPVRHG